MVFFENLRIAIQSLWANPLRSLLTLTGMAVGIAAVLYVVALGNITQQRINERLESLGSNILLIRPGYSRMHGVRTGAAVVNMKWDEARVLERESAVIIAAIPTYSGQINAEYQDRNWRSRATGTTDNYFPVNNEKLVLGRAFDARELAQRSRVAILGDTVWQELFERQSVIGKTVLINSQRFVVIGVLEAKGEGWSNPDDQIFVPLTTAQERLFGVDNLSSILAQMDSPKGFDEALFDIETILRRAHRLRDDQENDFRVRRQDLFLSTIQDTNKEIADFIIIIALVSLFVGGLGIANVMLVSVTERIREIGIRRSLGAKRHHILIQFLTEAVVLGLVGGLLGIAGGAGFNRFHIGPGAPLLWDWVGYSFFICVGIGATAGLFPAIKAANKDVIDALRYE
jgi:putative ABC transport system permease protein